MCDILRMERVYRKQMTEIRETVLRFVEPKGWQLGSLGRRAHVFVEGKINNLDGNIQISMEERDWRTMPKRLQPETWFGLFCSAGLNLEGPLRRFGDTELCWRAPFSILLDTVNRFLPIAWEMLSEMTEENLLKEWPDITVEPDLPPDLPPDFGPPRKLRRS